MSNYGDGGYWYTMPVSQVHANAYGDAAAPTGIRKFIPSGKTGKAALVLGGVALVVIAALAMQRGDEELI